MIDGMKTETAILHFGGQTALAAALGITQPSVCEWGEYPPDRRQLQLERLTRGALRAEPECEERVLGIPSRAA